MSQRPSPLPPELLKVPVRNPVHHFAAVLSPASDTPSIELAMQIPRAPAPHYARLVNTGVRKQPWGSAE